MSLLQGFFFMLHNLTGAHTHKPRYNTFQKTLPWVLFQTSRHPFFLKLLQTHTQKHTLEDKEISERVAEGDRREVQEANVTTDSISSKLDLFLPAPLKTLRLVVVLCLHHPEAPRSGACWALAWHQKDHTTKWATFTQVMCSVQVWGT